LGVVLAACVLPVTPALLGGFAEYRVLRFGGRIVMMMIWRPPGGGGPPPPPTAPAEGNSAGRLTLSFIRCPTD
ncbi:hypothetical protein PT247_14215, partial [Klebsiella pneumoniae]